MTTEEELSQGDKILKLVANGTDSNSASFASSQEGIEYYNLWADFWRSVAGVSVMAKQTGRSACQGKLIPDSQYIVRKNQGVFKNGIAIAGKAWPYKLAKKYKALDQVEGPGHNAILSTPSSMSGDE